MSEYHLTKPEDIQKRILTVRNLQVMLDSDLAEYYGVETKRLNQQVNRKKERFPNEFCFQLTDNEFEFLRLQIVTLEGNSLRFQIGTLEEADPLRLQNATSKMLSQNAILAQDTIGTTEETS